MPGRELDEDFDKELEEDFDRELDDVFDKDFEEELFSASCWSDSN